MVLCVHACLLLRSGFLWSQDCSLSGSSSSWDFPVQHTERRPFPPLDLPTKPIVFPSLLIAGRFYTTWATKIICIDASGSSSGHLITVMREPQRLYLDACPGSHQQSPSSCREMLCGSALVQEETHLLGFLLVIFLLWTTWKTTEQWLSRKLIFKHVDFVIIKIIQTCGRTLSQKKNVKRKTKFINIVTFPGHQQSHFGIFPFSLLCPSPQHTRKIYTCV